MRTDPTDNSVASGPSSHPDVFYERGWIAPEPGPIQPERIQILLFLVTCVTTTLAGIQASPIFYDRYSNQDISWHHLFLPENLLLGLPFSATLRDPQRHVPKARKGAVRRTVVVADIEK